MIGIGPSAGNLSELARAGGTSDYYSATTPSALTDALRAIAGKVASCTFTLSKPASDPKNIAVSFDGNRLPDDAWILSSDGQQVELSVSACDAIKSGSAQEERILMGCVPIPPGTILQIGPRKSDEPSPLIEYILESDNKTRTQKVTSKKLGKMVSTLQSTGGLGVPEKTAVDVRIVSKVGGVDYKTKDYQGATGALPASFPRPQVLAYDASLSSPEPWMLGAVENSPGGCAAPTISRAWSGGDCYDDERHRHPQHTSRHCGCSEPFPSSISTRIRLAARWLLWAVVAETVTEGVAELARGRVPGCVSGHVPGLLGFEVDHPSASVRAVDLLCKTNLAPAAHDFRDALRGECEIALGTRAGDVCQDLRITVLDQVGPLAPLRHSVHTAAGMGSVADALEVEAHDARPIGVGAETAIRNDAALLPSVKRGRIHRGFGMLGTNPDVRPGAGVSPGARAAANASGTARRERPALSASLPGTAAIWAPAGQGAKDARNQGQP